MLQTLWLLCDQKLEGCAFGTSNMWSLNWWLLCQWTTWWWWRLNSFMLKTRVHRQHTLVSWAPCKLRHTQIKDLGEPTHILIPCWMPKPLPSRNQCIGWFAPTQINRVLELSFFFETKRRTSSLNTLPHTVVDAGGFHGVVLPLFFRVLS